MTPISSVKPTVLEFFAGIGLARLGLESAGFNVSWANDYEADKRDMYEGNFGAHAKNSNHQFVLGDIGLITAGDLPRGTSLAWASSPCTDLSLAGTRAGFAGAQSGTFWHFVRLLKDLRTENAHPEVVVLENVIGLATSHGGDDLAAAIRAFNELDYSVDVITLDARRFVPQSRPRLFLIGAKNPPVVSDLESSDLRPDWLQAVYGDTTLKMHRTQLPLPPKPLTSGLGNMVEVMASSDGRWWDEARTLKFTGSLSPVQFERVAALRDEPGVRYRTAYRRTRNGVAVWEVRPDDIAGCLRTARGGSSKQAVVRLGDGEVHVRWMTPLEYARLMGAGDYVLDSLRDNQVLFGFGDAVAVPVVRWLAENYLMPLVRGEFQTVELEIGIAVVQ